ncbi:MAG: threonine/serine dehydratase [Bacteroidota bacterium]
MKSLIEAAHQRIRPHIRRTPLEYDLQLSQRSGANVYLKLENWQLSGSFKLRGVMSKVLAVPTEERSQRYFVAASTGNHAAAFAYTMHRLGLRGKVFLPEGVAPAKLSFIRSFKVDYELYGQDSLQTEIHARRYAEQQGAILVHPYNDPLIVAGQGTIGLEISEQLPEVDSVIVPVGGGGLISGIGGYLKGLRPDIQLIGCQPERSPEMYVSLQKGHIIEESITQPTLSDGTAGGIEPGAITFGYCQQYMDDLLLVEEPEIAEALRWSIQNRQMIIEGSAGLSIATLLREKMQFAGKNVVLIICGKRLSWEKLQKIIKEG